MLIGKRWGEASWLRARGALLAVICLVGMGLYARVLEPHYPIDTWLAWRFALLVFWCLLFSAGALGAGSFVVERLLPGVRLPRLEALVLSMGAGVVVFALAMYVGGAAAWFGSVFAVALALGLGCLGARSLPRLLARDTAPVATQPSSWLNRLVLGFGIISLGLVYLGVLTPEAINYDATWSHLTIAQDYAREGRIVAFPADYNKQVPHLASIVYSWGFMVPGLDVSGHWMLAQHLEFTAFLWTLVGVAAAIDWITQSEVRAGWSALFLFPAIFVYDGNLGAAADHILAFFGPPILLAARHFLPRLALRPAVLVGIVLGGAALTKYQAMYFVVPFTGLMLLRLLMLLFVDLRAKRRVDVRLLAGSLAVVVAVLLVMAPHFIKNAVFHGNPVYPFMQRVFAGSHPIAPESWFDFENIYLDQAWVPKGTTFEKLSSTLAVFFTFSFVPHYSFFGGVPMFGSLFTLLLPCVLVLRRNRRLWLSIALASGGILMWAATFRVDRNLQIVLPLVAVATGGLVLEIWRFGRIARVGLVPLMALQLIWGGDAAFYSGFPRYKDAIDLLRSGMDKRAATRFDSYHRPYRDLGAALPKDAKVLIHNGHPSLGIDREVVLDWTGFQALIHYGHLGTVHDLVVYYRKLGITHLVDLPGSRPGASKQEEILWQDLLRRQAASSRRFGHLRLTEVPAVPPPQTAPYRVLCLGLEGYADGVYDITDLSTNEYRVPALRSYRPPRVSVLGLEQAASSLGEVTAVLIGAKSDATTKLHAGLQAFTSPVRYVGNFTVYLRKR